MRSRIAKSTDCAGQKATMTDLTIPSRKLTHEGVRRLIDAAVTKATAMGVPVEIAIAGDGARPLAQESASAKAMTAASHRMPMHKIPYEVGMALSVTTQGKVMPLRGGLPIVFDGYCVGGIGCGSGTSEQDEIIARAALAAVGAENPPD